MSAQVTRTECERYFVVNSGEHASIYVRAWQRHGVMTGGDVYYCGELTIQSTFGTVGYTWTACGEPFKRFLVSLDEGYLLTKLFGVGLTEFDGDGSINEAKRRVREARQRSGLSRDVARSLYDALDDVKYEAGDSLDAFVRCISEVRRDHARELRCDRNEDLLSEPWEFAAEKINAQASGLWKHIWLPFVEALREELAEAVA